MREQIGVLISEADVDARIAEMAAEIDKAYAGKTVHLIGILKGSVFFMCQLARKLTVPVTMDFMSVSSYGDDTKSSGIVKLNKDLDEAIEGKNVIIVEDILDSGRTLSYLVKLL
jgi:hypoxanthine phosphoribosyltransferase